MFSSYDASKNKEKKPKPKNEMKLSIQTPLNTRVSVCINYDALLGKGNFAKVYSGYHAANKGALAIKVIGSTYSNIEICKREIAIMEITTLANAKNVMPMTGFKIKEEMYNYLQVSIAMPYAVNGTLESCLIKKPSLSLNIKFQIAQGVLTGISEMHKHDIIHCDIKPENVVLNKDMQPLLCDLGLARRIKNDNLNKAVGSPYFMSPQILLAFYRKIAVTVDKKDDIYSFSLLCWCIYANQDHPFQSIDNGAALTALVCDKKGREPIPADCPPKLRNLIIKAWNEDRAQRPSAQEGLTSLNEKSNLYASSPNPTIKNKLIDEKANKNAGNSSRLFSTIKRSQSMSAVTVSSMAKKPF